MSVMTSDSLSPAREDDEDARQQRIDSWRQPVTLMTLKRKLLGSDR